MSSLPAAQLKSRTWRDRARLILQTVVVPVITSVTAGVVLYHFTRAAPNLEVSITRPVPAQTKNRLTQFVMIRNTGSESVAGIRIVVLEFADRGASQTLEAMPPREEPCKEILTPNGDLSLNCGKLQPNGTIQIILEYRKPPLTFDHINAYADNATSKKSTDAGLATGRRG